jgi:acyl carrier protein
VSPADSSSTRDRVQEIVAEILEIAVGDIGADDSFYDDLGATSLEKVAMITHFEREFGISIGDAEAAAVRSVADAAVLVAERAERITVDLVGRLLGDRGERRAYLDPDVGEVSYARLRAAAADYASGLGAVEPGTRALVVAEDSVATVVAVLGLWWAGCVPVLAGPMLTDADLRYLVDDSRPPLAHLDLPPARQETLRAAYDWASVSTGEELRARFRTAPGTSAGSPHQWLTSGEALVQYTSGSTGTPKGVRHSAGGISAMLDGFGSVARFTQDDLVLSTARMSFGYGFGSSVLCALAAGSAVVLLRGTVDRHAVAAALREHRPTVFCSVPRLYADLVRAADGFDSPRLCVSAGESCPPALIEAIRDAFGAEFMNCLGATEVMHVVLATPAQRRADAMIGVAVPGVTATVRDEHGAQVRDGLQGRLHIAGATVALGYLGRSGAGTFADGGAYTGDLVRRTADGDFEYLCRADDILNLGGYKVAPAEIETVVRGAAGVRECVVVGGADEHGLQQAIAYVVTDGTPEDDVRRAVRARLRTGLAAYKRPARVEFLDALPTTTTGKVAKFALRERVARS